MVGREASRTITPSLSSTKNAPTPIAASATNAQNASSTNDSMAIGSPSRRSALVGHWALPPYHCGMIRHVTWRQTAIVGGRQQFGNRGGDPAIVLGLGRRT